MLSKRCQPSSSRELEPGLRAQFHLEQAKLRAARRLREGRPRPVDTLLRMLHLTSEFGVAPEPPYAAFDKLGLGDLRDLAASVQELQACLCWLVTGHAPACAAAQPLGAAAGSLAVCLSSADSHKPLAHMPATRATCSLMIAQAASVALLSRAMACSLCRSLGRGDVAATGRAWTAQRRSIRPTGRQSWW